MWAGETRAKLDCRAAHGLPTIFRTTHFAPSTDLAFPLGFKPPARSDVSGPLHFAARCHFTPLFHV